MQYTVISICLQSISKSIAIKILFWALGSFIDLGTHPVLPVNIQINGKQKGHDL